MFATSGYSRQNETTENLYSVAKLKAEFSISDALMSQGKEVKEKLPWIQKKFSDGKRISK